MRPLIQVITLIQLDLGRNQRYTEVCPLLVQPSPGASYLHPVQTNRDIQLVTRNLHSEVREREREREREVVLF